MAEDIFAKKVPFADVARLLIYSLPQIIAYSFPFGTLLGALMALGRFSADSELLAVLAAGIPMTRVFLPLLLVGLIFSCISFASNDFLLPISTIEFNRVYRKIIYSNPAVELEPRTVKRYENTSIVTGALEDNTFSDVVIIDRTESNEKRVITAKRAVLGESESQSGVISLTLNAVFTLVAGVRPDGRFDYATAEEMNYNILLQDISVSLATLGPREMSSVDVWQEIVRKQSVLQAKETSHREKIQSLRHELLEEIMRAADVLRRNPDQEDRQRSRLELLGSRIREELAQAPTDRDLTIHLFEFHKKFSIPLACLVFMVFAFPAGLLARRSGRTFGFLVGIIVTFVYWLLLFFGQTGGMRYEFPPAVAMWLPDVVIMILGIFLLLLRRNV